MLARFLIALTCASALALLAAQAQAQSSLPGLFGLSRPSAGCVFPDAGTFSPGATCGVPAQGLYQTTATANPLVSGQAGALQATINRALHINVRNSTGVEVLPATSTLQGTNSATTAHTCSVAGFSELGCLGQIDDDIKASLPVGTNVIGYNSNDVCAQSQPLNAAIGTAGATNVQAVAGVSAKKVYICSLSLIAGAAAVFNVIEGTGAACTTANEAAIIGSTTAANGMSLAANGGLTLGNGKGTIGVTATAANGVCILVSASVQFGGNLTYVQQ